MASRNGVKWNREETILAFELYCKTTFGKISQSNEDVIELANLLGRTPGSVALKMHNLAHHDPELKKRNISAMSHGSKLDGEVFEEFTADWMNLSFQAQQIRARMQGKSMEEIIDLGDIMNIPPGQYREHIMKARVGQYFFRMSVLNAYSNRCCVTGIKKDELLIASHIKPWAVSDEKSERTNPMNGLCLNALHDKAFDRGLITITTNYKIAVSPHLKEAEMDSKTKEWFMSYDHKKIMLPDKFYPQRDFLEYHNDIVFLK